MKHTEINKLMTSDRYCWRAIGITTTYNINSLSAKPTKWSNTLELFECAWPFCRVDA